MRRVQQGDVLWSNQPLPAGRRPVLVLTRTPAIVRLNSIIVAQMSTTVRDIDSEVLLGPEDGMEQQCVANLDDLATLSRVALEEHITTLSAERMLDVFRALRYVFDLPELR